MIDYKNIKNLYFIGIGGIGMSALARFARHAGKNVAGYDLTETPLTNSLIAEGISVHYIDNPKLIPEDFFPENTLVVRTPAVPAHHLELNWLKKKGYVITKRSELLGYLTREHRCIAVAGTHGKTSVSTMTTHLLTEAGFDTGAFLGGISRNFNSNLVLPRGEHPYMVAEADEFDRSFLQLSPTLAIITSMDADHLDIYGHHEALKEAFMQFIGRVRQEGIVIFKKGLPIITEIAANLSFFTYSINEEADFCVESSGLKMVLIAST
jgi:UDP-N-acetylmuramate--alanine ligase